MVMEGKTEMNETEIKIGFQMHKYPARYFFEQARDTISLSQQDSRLLAYTLGFLCHFILDSNCHGYIYSSC